MARIYGHKWTSINDADDGTWLSGLSDVEPGQVAYGLSVLIKEHHEWPPTLPEFRYICLGCKEEMWQHKTSVYGNKSSFAALPKLKARASIVEAERKKLRKIGVLN